MTDYPALSKYFRNLNFLYDKDRIDSKAVSLTRSTAFFVTIVLTIGFTFTAIFGNLTEWMFVTYPIGVAILFAPALANKLLEKVKR